MRSTMMKPHEIALRDEQIDLRIQVVVSREQRGCQNQIAAMEARIAAIDRKLATKA